MSMARTVYDRLPLEFRVSEQTQGYTLESSVKTYYRRKQLGLTDTKHPDAIVISPVADFNDEFETAATKRFIQQLNTEYDLLLRVAKTEGDAYKTITEARNAQLLILAGHGIPGTLSLGEEEHRMNKPAEELVINKKDRELGEYLDLLAPNAVIFLYSCYSKDLVDFVKQHAKERTVIGATASFSSEEFDILSWRPFDIRISNKTYKR